MALPPPWNRIESSLQDLQEYALGAERIADFFKGMEEKYGPDELLVSLLGSNPPGKWLERFLFALLAIGVSDRQIGTRALELRRLRRLWMRASHGGALSAGESKVAETIAPLFGMDPKEREERLASASKILQTVLDGGEVEASGRQALSGLIRSEAEALRDRVDWLSENVDPYDMKIMARILPRLRIYDEAVAEGMELAAKLERGDPVGVKVLSFEMHMKGAFEKWRKKIEACEPLQGISRLLAAQREKKIPTLDLIALSSLCRWRAEVAQEKSSLTDWIAKAFASYRDGEFTVEAGESAALLASALGSSGVKAKGTVLTGHFGKKLYPALVGRDLLTKPFLKASDEGLLDMKSLIAQNITRDSVLESLMTNPKVFQAPGLIGFIAQTSRSLAILSRIAKSRELHGGFANRDVPMALLLSPCNVPMSLLRPLISVRHVSLAELKHIARARAGIRREVVLEVQAYLDNRG